jgi:hypothetical protein
MLPALPLETGVTVILAIRSPGQRYWTTKAHSAATVGYGVGGGVVSPRRVMG